MTICVCVFLGTRKTLKDYPVEKDWVKDGAVTSVKDQGDCGSCFAFSTIGNMEGVTFVSRGVLANLSAQQIVSCDHECSVYQGSQICDWGCAGGLMTNAMTYAVKHGMTTWERFPYNDKDFDIPCKYNQSMRMFNFSDWRGIDGNDMDMIAALNEMGPLSVGVSSKRWQFYKSGIFTLPCGTKQSHGVLLVGYGMEGKKEFWKIKNSWGADWGEDGYIRIVRGKNKCGVNSFVNTVLP